MTGTYVICYSIIYHFNLYIMLSEIRKFQILQALNTLIAQEKAKITGKNLTFTF